jgi:hypothetical protein
LQDNKPKTQDARRKAQDKQRQHTTLTASTDATPASFSPAAKKTSDEGNGKKKDKHKGRDKHKGKDKYEHKHTQKHT